MPAPNDPHTSGGTDVLERTEEQTGVDLPWQVLLWNDPVNLTQFVTLTLRRVLKISAEEAERLMLLAHTEGRAVVKTGTKATCLQVATDLGASSLWATMEKAA